AQATPSMFLDSSGKPLPFETAVLSGRATGVPGAVAMLALAQKEHGRLAWSSLFSSAERIADEGFIVSPRLGRLIAGDFPENTAPDVVAYFRRADGGRLMYADRDRFVGDPAFTTVPVEGLLARDYIAARAKLIGETAMPASQPGNPAGAVPASADRTLEPTGTSHFIIRDAAGNVVSMT